MRYTDEDKKALVATIDTDPSHGCDIVTGDCVYDFPFQGATEPADITSSNWTPKVGFTWRKNDDMQVYGHYTQGHRSGGINLRHTVTTAAAQPYTPEKQHAFELGVKADNADKTIRFNAAVFYNKFSNLQRETNDPHPVAGVVQRILNTADARVMGAEGELTAEIAEGLTFTGSLGLLDDKYTNVLSDLTGDGVINSADLDLHLPRLAPMTYGGGLIYYTDVAEWGSLTANVFFNHRDFAWYNDANSAPLYAVDMLDASITVGLMEEKVQVSFYGKNLLDEVQAGGTTNLPVVPPIGLSGGTFAPLKKGRVFGASVKYSF